MSVPFVQVGGLELRHLVALQAVAAEGSFGRAALRLGFTQSAISQQIAALERIAGLALFDRPGGPRPVRLTEAGSVLLAHANAVLDRLAQAESAISSLRSGESGRVRVGTFQSVSVRVLPGIVTELKRIRPGIDVQLEEADAAEPSIDAVRSGGLDVAFVVAPFDEQGLEVIHLFEDPYVLLCPPGSPLADVDGDITAATLQSVALVGQAPNACQLNIEHWMVRGGISPNVVFRSSDNAAVQAMVRAGIGHAVMPQLAIDTDDPGVVVRSLTLPPRRVSFVAAPSPPSSAVALFTELALRWCREHLDVMQVRRAG